MTDTTYTDKDVIRIYEKHLDKIEQFWVKWYFFQQWDYKSQEPRPPLPFQGEALAALTFDNWETLHEITVLLDKLENIMQQVEDVFGDDLVETSRELNRRYGEAIEEIDRQLEEIRQLLDSIGVPDAVIDKLFSGLREFRRVARVMRVLVAIPAQLSDHRVMLDDMGHFLNDFLDKEDALHTGLEEYFGA